MKRTNWQAMQVPYPPTGIKPRYMAMGSWKKAGAKTGTPSKAGKR